MRLIVTLTCATAALALLTGCANETNGISVARALCDIKVGFLKERASFPASKVGVITSTINVELVVEATRTSKGQVELGLARDSTPTTVGALFSRERALTNRSTITIAFVNPATLPQSTIAGMENPPPLENLGFFSGKYPRQPSNRSDLDHPKAERASGAVPDAAQQANAAREQVNFDCASLDRPFE